MASSKFEEDKELDRIFWKEQIQISQIRPQHEIPKFTWYVVDHENSTLIGPFESYKAARIMVKIDDSYVFQSGLKTIQHENEKIAHENDFKIKMNRYYHLRLEGVTTHKATELSIREDDDDSQD